MIRQENPNFKASRFAPNPLEVTYWIDLTEDPNGGTIKVYDGKEWYPINNSNIDIPAASTTNVGGIKIGYVPNGKNYRLLLDANNRAYVNVPWTEYTLPEATTSTIGGVRKGAAVNNLAADADITAVVTKINALLASLRTAKIIDTPAS